MLTLTGRRRGFFKRVLLNLPTFRSSRVGDIILSCNGELVKRMYDLNVHYAAESVNLVALGFELGMLIVANFEKGTGDGCCSADGIRRRWRNGSICLLGRGIAARSASSRSTTSQDVTLPRLHLGPQPRISGLSIRINEYHVYYAFKRDRDAWYPFSTPLTVSLRLRHI
jgi:hypothetical protein